MDVIIRKAQLTDQGDIAQLIYSSGMDIYDYLYGDDALNFILYGFEQNLGFCGHSNVSVVIKDDEVVATGCFYDLEQFITNAKGNYQNILNFFNEVDAKQVLARLSKTASVVKPPKEGEVYLSNFGVSPSMRGLGIGTKLIEHELNQAREIGKTIFGLDVSAENPKAQKLYERLGLSIVAENTFEDSEAGVANSRKMEMAL